MFLGSAVVAVNDVIRCVDLELLVELHACMFSQCVPLSCKFLLEESLLVFSGQEGQTSRLCGFVGRKRTDPKTAFL